MSVARLRSILPLLLLFGLAAVFPLTQITVKRGTLLDDSARIACMAAAYDHPERFTRDYVFSDPANFKFYTPLYIQSIRLLKKLTGSYFRAFEVQYVWVLSLKVIGFYLLMLSLCGRRLDAWLYAIAMMCPVSVPWDSWGHTGVILPRELLAASVPWVLWMAYGWRAQPKRWPWVGFLTGCCIAIHPVGAPSIQASVMLWLLYRAYRERSPRAWRYFFGSCLAMLIPTAIYGFYYLTHRAYGTLPSGTPEVRYALSLVFDPSWFDPDQFFSTAAQFLRKFPILLFGACLIFAGSVISSARDAVRAVMLWAWGIAIVSLGIPFLDHVICQARGVIPAEIDLLRGFRYLLPLFLMGYPLVAIIFASLPYPLVKQVVQGLASMVLVVWIVMFSPFDVIIASWLQGRGVPWIAAPASLRVLRDQQVEAAVANLPPGSLLYSDEERLGVRFSALQSLFFTNQDGTIICYANWSGVPEWLRRRRVILRYCLEDVEPCLQQLAVEKVDYLLSTHLSSRSDRYVKNGQRVWSNGHQTLIKIRPPVSEPRKRG
jgi:hypothetical protein